MLKIREVQSEDIYSILKLAYETLPERYNPLIFNHFYEYFRNSFLVAEKNHKIIGFLIGIITNNFAKILMISINVDYRKQGVATILLNKFFEQMISKNINIIELETRVDNTAAISFYKKHGFKEIEKIKNFYQNGEDAILLKKKL